MNSLSESILKDIDSINESCIDAQFAVVEASIELEQKYVDMINISNTVGFIQESKAGDWFAYDPNEKVIKTILLAIPRLIVNIILLLRKKWKEYSIKKKCEKIKDDIDKVINMEISVEQLMKTRDDIISQIPDGVTFENGRTYFLSRVINMDKIKSYYENTCNVFNDYATAIQNDNDELVLGYSKIHMETKEVLSQGVTNGAPRKFEITAYQGADYDELIALVDGFADFESFVTKSLDEVNKSMRELEKWVQVSLNSETISENGISKDLANRLLDDARKIRDEFMNADTIIRAAIIETVNNWSAVTNFFQMQMQLYNQYNDEVKTKARESQEARKKLEKEHPEFKDYDPAMFKDTDDNDEEE